MPHEDDLDGEDLSEISFTEPNEGDEEEEEDDPSSNLSHRLHGLDIKDPTIRRHLDTRVPSASVRRLSHDPRPRNLRLVLDARRGEHKDTIDNSTECAPEPRGWSRVFPSTRP